MTTTRHAPLSPSSAGDAERRPLSVLVALDGSDPSRIGRDLVADLAWPASTTIHLLTAYHVPVDWTGGFGATMSWVGDFEDQIRDELAAQLREMAEPLIERGLTVRQHVVRGRAASAIVEAAEELGVELVVIGSRGHSPLRSMLLGSVATEVATDAHCAVLVARAPAISHLLVATDGSDTARSIPDQLAAWGLFDGMPVEVVSVLVSDPAAFELFTGLSTLGDERISRMRRELEEKQLADLEQATGALAASGLIPTPRAASGDPTREIISAAEASDADLIVTGSRGLHGLERILLGSVARNVLMHADCSVLVVRPAQAATAFTPDSPAARSEDR